MYFDVFKPKRKKDDYPVSPFVCIRIDYFMLDREGNNLISPHLMTEREVDEHIDRLVQDLEIARKKAKSLLKNG